MSGKTARHIRSFPPEAERAAAGALLTALADRAAASALDGWVFLRRAGRWLALLGPLAHGLERLVAAKHVLDAATIERRKAAWVQAYRATPHGQPVVLPHNAA
jgi:hypothetical protein